MKVFISHSSSDKWAARRIAKDLEDLKIETFLDEKDIKTGESIDIKIQENLSQCDDLLILITPASVNSQWVLIELGGAIALKKNIIPILMHVGVNDIPSVINKLLGRDINEIEKYYAEIKSKSPIPKRIKPVLPITVLKTFEIGDRVQLPKIAKPINEPPGWNDDMDKYLGLQTTVKDLRTEYNAVGVDIDGGAWTWAIDWLVKIE